MAKMFYTADEAATLLGKTEDDLKKLVREGKLREFRDADTVSFKVEDVEALRGDAGSDSSIGGASASASGDIVLEPVEDSSVELPPSGSDVLSLEDLDAGDTSSGAGTTTPQKSKEDTVVPSVGVNVFDDEELDEHVDPLAQTAVTDVAGLGVEGPGSGSGILDLTRESDDTSLGAELLEEIYSDDEATIEMGDKTRAGLDEAIPKGTAEEEEPLEAVEAESGTEAEAGEEAAVPAEAAPAARRAVVREVVEYGPDAVSSGLTALMAVALAVMLFGGLGAAALVRGVTPALIESVYTKLWMYTGAALVVAVIAAAVTYLLAKRSG